MFDYTSEGAGAIHRQVERASERHSVALEPHSDLAVIRELNHGRVAVRQDGIRGIAARGH